MRWMKSMRWMKERVVLGCLEQEIQPSNLEIKQHKLSASQVQEEALFSFALQTDSTADLYLIK